MRRFVATLPVVAVAVAVLAGCGGGGGSTTSTPRTSGSTTGAASATAEIRRAWTTFFDGGTPAQRRIALLQDGQSFAPAVRAQSHVPIANRTSAKVSSVRLTGPTRATVVYTVSVAGLPVLKDRKGTAVRVNGAWKVGDQSFCALVGLGGTKVPGCSGG